MDFLGLGFCLEGRDYGKGISLLKERPSTEGFSTLSIRTTLAPLLFYTLRFYIRLYLEKKELHHE